MPDNRTFRDKVKGMFSGQDRFQKLAEINADKLLHTVMAAYEKEIKFLPKNLMPTLDNGLHTRNILEYSVWYSGKQEQLKRFYRQSIRTIEGGELFRESTSFWKDNREDETYIFTHSGFPQSLTQTSVDLETMAGFDYTINGIEDTEDEVYERLEEILKNSKFSAEKWQQGTALKSVFGGTVFRPIINTNIAPTPIIEVVQPEQFRLKVQNGYPTGFTFVETIIEKDANGSEVYVEILEHNEQIDGDAAISYEVVRYLPGKNEPINVPLAEYFGDKAKFYEPIIIKGYGNSLPVYIKNKASNSEFRGSSYGESDYSNNIDLFHALDQAQSSLVNQLADAQMKTMINENLIDKNINGDWSNWKKWRRSYIVTKGEMDEVGNKAMIDHSQARVDFEAHIATADYIIQNILSNVGLAPESLGINGAGANASGEAIRQRDNVSTRTREKKLNLQAQGLSELFENLLKLQDYQEGRPLGEYEINVTFPSFSQMTLNERVEIATKMAGSGVFDLKTILEMIFTDKTDEEIQIIIDRVNEEEELKKDKFDPEGLDEEEQDKLKNYTYAELREMAKTKEIEGYVNMTKAQLAEALNL